MTKGSGDKGIFVVFEGLDGAGTTTQTRMVQAALSAAWPGVPCVASAEPSSGPIGSVVRQVLRHRIQGFDVFGGQMPFDPAALALLFAADRLDHFLCEIKPVVEMGGIAISDRYKLSSLAYQSLDVEYEWVQSINSMAPEPDLLIFLDVPADIAWKRVSANRVHREIFEIPEILKKVQTLYHEAIKRMNQKNLLVIDGTLPPEKIASISVEAISARIPRRQGAE